MKIFPCLAAAMLALAMSPATALADTHPSIRFIATSDAKKPALPRDPRRDALKKITADASIRIANEAAFFGQLDLTRPELQEVSKAVAKKDWGAAKIAWAKHLDERKNPKWLWSWRDREKIKSFLAENGTNLADHIKAADQTMRREFNIQAVPRKLDRDIDWEAYEYEYEWCNVLNRHGYWRTLGFAWWASGDTKYVDDWLFMLRDWLADNPAGKGQPWRSLEVGGRASTWFDIMYTFMDAPGFDASMKYEMSRSLAEHARFLHKNNAKFKKGNWQTQECTGLASVGIMLPEFKEASAWRERAFGLMAKHMIDGVYPDGAQYELTPGYHYHVMMQFLHVQRLADLNGYKVPGLAHRHEKMFEFLMHLSTPDRRHLSHGDAGLCRGRSIQDSMALGALLYKRPEMRYLAQDQVSADWIWMFSPEELAAYKKLPSAEPTFRSHMLPHAQYGVMRTSWKPDSPWLFFDAGPYGGAHSHGDQLQVLLHAGRDLILDPGQISYDQPISKYFKSAQAHNGLLVNGQGAETTVNPKVTGWCLKEHLEFASARIEHHGVSHQRSVLFVKPDYWLIVDHVSGKGSPKLTRQFHLPKVAVEKQAQSVRTTFPDGTNLSIHAVDDAVVEMREAPAALGKTPGMIPVADLINSPALPVALGTVLMPHRDPKQLPKIERLPSKDPSTLSLRVTFPDGRVDTIAVADEPRELRIEDKTGKGVALWVRNGSNEKLSELIPQMTIKGPLK